MEFFQRISLASVLIACTLLVSSGGAHAYIDPGTGSYILQIVIAGLVGAAFTLKLFWKRIQLFFHKGSAKQDGRRAEKPTDDDG
jgi:hypothetical protein